MGKFGQVLRGVILKQRVLGKLGQVLFSAEITKLDKIAVLLVGPSMQDIFGDVIASFCTSLIMRALLLVQGYLSLCS